MGLPPLAKVEDLEIRQGRSYEGTEAIRALAALEESSSYVREEAGQEWIDEETGLVAGVPDIAFSITIRAAGRSLINPMDADYQAIGPFSFRSTTNVYLTKAEKAVLHRFRPDGKSGLWTQSTTRGEDGGEVFLYDKFADSDPILYGTWLGDTWG